MIKFERGNVKGKTKSVPELPKVDSAKNSKKTLVT